MARKNFQKSKKQINRRRRLCDHPNKSAKAFQQAEKMFDRVKKHDLILVQQNGNNTMISSNVEMKTLESFHISKIAKPPVTDTFEDEEFTYLSDVSDSWEDFVGGICS